MTTFFGSRDRVRQPRAVRNLLKSRLGIVSLISVALIAIISFVGPNLSPYGGSEAHLNAVFQPVGTVGYVLGTDNLGRDILTRTLYGAQSSLIVAVLAVLITLAIGLPLGVIAGTWHKADLIISRVTDIILAFPSLILAVGLAAIASPGPVTVAIALGSSQIPKIIRVMRVETLRVRSLDFVTSAVVQGAGTPRILGLYVIPNSIAALIVQVTVILPTVILGEAGLSFLGLGLQPPSPSLGVMLAESQQYFQTAPWAAVVPGIVLALICLAFNAFGDALRDAFDVNTL